MDYSFGKKRQSHKFCPVCGVAIWIRKFDIEPEKRGRLAENDKVWRAKLSISLRLFNNVEWEVKVRGGEKSVVVRKGDWKRMEPLYVVPE